jgi:hypothetical protein
MNIVRSMLIRLISAQRGIFYMWLLDGCKTDRYGHNN